MVVKFTRIDKMIDSELEWKRFYSDVLDDRQTDDTDSRYIRVNVDLESAPPKLDDKGSLKGLQAETSHLLKTDYKPMIENIAHTLIASCFYFFKEDAVRKDDSQDSISIGEKFLIMNILPNLSVQLCR